MDIGFIQIRYDEMKKSYAEIIVINVFLVPENMGVDTKMKFVRVSGNEIQVKIGRPYR